MARYRARRRIATQVIKPIQHSDTVVANIGAASVPQTMVVLDTEAGARPLTGSTSTIQVGQGTNEEVNVGTTVAYVNLFIQVGNRFSGTVDDSFVGGWLEWAFVCVKESETAVPITNLGVQTLGDVCTKMFLNECIFTGNLPIGERQPNKLDIQLKIPKFKQSIKRGDQWRFVTAYRDMKATSTSTTSTRLIKSFMFKSYN